eukprot:scaffold1583_cov299-Pinguiococcus_pyrenoidosus.AAC.28
MAAVSHFPRRRASKMEKFRRTIVNEEALREHFDSYDASADGKLQPVELAKLCEGALHSQEMNDLRMGSGLY